VGQPIPPGEIESRLLLIQVGEVFQVNVTGTQVRASFDGSSMHRQKGESLAKSPFQPSQHLSRKLTAFCSTTFVYHKDLRQLFLLEKLS